MVIHLYTINSYAYVDYKKPNTILVLHGWGCSINYMIQFKKEIHSSNLLFIDLPGFGNNPHLISPFNITDFSNTIITFLQTHNFDINYIVGHSFGGKIAILIAKQLKIKCLFLIAPSIFHKRRFIIYYLKIYFYKIAKKIKLSKKVLNMFGSKDYKELNPVMKRTMSLVINEDITLLLESLKTPMVVFFGDKDKVTPLYLYKKIKKHAFDSTLIKLKGDHFAYLSNIKFISNIIEGVINL